MEIACMRSNIETVEIMLESASADRFNENDKYDNQWSPVHCCCISGNAKILKLLIESGLDYSSQNVWKQTPLHICAVKGYVECATVLINRYNLRELLIKDEFGKTAEKIAVFNHKQNVVRLIQRRMHELKKKERKKYGNDRRYNDYQEEYSSHNRRNDQYRNEEHGRRNNGGRRNRRG